MCCVVHRAGLKRFLWQNYFPCERIRVIMCWEDVGDFTVKIQEVLLLYVEFHVHVGNVAVVKQLSKIVFESCNFVPSAQYVQKK